MLWMSFVVTTMFLTKMWFMKIFYAALNTAYRNSIVVYKKNNNYLGMNSVMEQLKKGKCLFTKRTSQKNLIILENLRAKLPPKYPDESGDVQIEKITKQKRLLLVKPIFMRGTCFILMSRMHRISRKIIQVWLAILNLIYIENGNDNCDPNYILFMIIRQHRHKL